MAKKNEVWSRARDAVNARVPPATATQVPAPINRSWVFKGEGTLKPMKCNLRGKTGIEEVDRSGRFIVIANRVLHDRGRASKFAVVKRRKAPLEALLSEVYSDSHRAEQAMLHLSGRS